MIKGKEIPGIEYLADRSNTDSDWYGVDTSWYVCHYCNETFIYDYGKSQRHEPNFCPVCGVPNRPVLICEEEGNND